MEDSRETFEGGCTCRAVRFRMTSRPLFVNCCHCSWCQRETGSAFVINALIEADRVEVLSGQPDVIMTPSNSGKGQKISRCPICHVALWSNYAGGGDLLRFVRVGTLDRPDLFPPDAHVFTTTKQPWVILPDGVPVMSEYYEREKCWPAESLARRKQAIEKARR